MRTGVLAGIAVLVSTGWALTPEAADGLQPAAGAAVERRDGSLLGIAGGDAGDLAWLDPGTLQARARADVDRWTVSVSAAAQGRRLIATSVVGGNGYDGGRLAMTTRRSSDLRTVRRHVVRVRDFFVATAVRLTDRRIVVAGPNEVVANYGRLAVIDPQRGRVIRSRRILGRPFAYQRAGRRLAVLVRIDNDTRLEVFGPDGRFERHLHLGQPFGEDAQLTYDPRSDRVTAVRMGPSRLRATSVDLRNGHVDRIGVDFDRLFAARARGQATIQSVQPIAGGVRLSVLEDSERFRSAIVTLRRGAPVRHRFAGTGLTSLTRTGALMLGYADRRLRSLASGGSVRWTSGADVQGILGIDPVAEVGDRVYLRAATLEPVTRILDARTGLQTAEHTGRVRLLQQPPGRDDRPQLANVLYAAEPAESYQLPGYDPDAAG